MMPQVCVASKLICNKDMLPCLAVSLGMGWGLAWKPCVRAADLNVSATRLKRVTVNKALSLSSATTLDDLGT